MKEDVLQISQDFYDDLNSPLEDKSSPIKAVPPTKETTPVKTKKSFFSLLSPDDSPVKDKVSSAAVMARIKKSKRDLAMSWSEGNVNKVSQDLANENVEKAVESISVPHSERENIDEGVPLKSDVTLTPPVLDFNSLPTLTPPSAIVLGPVEKKNIDDAMPDFSLTPPQLNSSPTFGRPIVLSPRPRLISSLERHDSQASTSSHGNMIQLEQQPNVQKQGEQLDELDVFGDDLDVHGRAEMSRNV